MLTEAATFAGGRSAVWRRCIDDQRDLCLQRPQVNTYGRPKRPFARSRTARTSAKLVHGGRRAQYRAHATAAARDVVVGLPEKKSFFKIIFMKKSKILRRTLLK